MTDPIEILRAALSRKPTPLDPRPELYEITHRAQDRIVNDIAQILAFEFKDPSIILGISHLSFADRQGFRENSAAHFRGAVDFTITRQSWHFRNMSSLGPTGKQPAEIYSELGLAVSRGLPGHRVIVEIISNAKPGFRNERQYLNGQLVRDWVQTERQGTTADHMHTQPEYNSPRIKRYIDAEYRLVGAVRDLANATRELEHARQERMAKEAAERTARSEAEQARERYQKEKRESDRVNKEQKEEAERKATKEREDAEAKERSKHADREKKEEETEKKRKERDNETPYNMELARYVQDAPVSFFEVILIILKAGISTKPDLFPREDAFDFIKTFLGELKKYREFVRKNSEEFEDRWTGEDPEEHKRYLNEILKTLYSKETDPDKFTLPWCGNGMLVDTYQAFDIGARYFELKEKQLQ